MPVTIRSLKPGDVLFEARYENAGNTTLKRLAVRSVRIIEVDSEFRSVLASWNGNTAKTFYPRYGKFASWRRTDPRIKPETNAALPDVAAIGDKASAAPGPVEPPGDLTVETAQPMPVVPPRSRRRP